MADRERAHTGELLRSFVLALEHAAAQAAAVPARSAAEGAVRGAADELRAELPELERELKAILRDGLTVLRRLARDAAERPGATPGDWAEGISHGVVRGAVDQLRDSMPVLDATAGAVAARLNKFLERSTLAAEARAEANIHPRDRARTIAAGAIQGAIAQLRDSLPELREPLLGLGPLGAHVASSTGRGFIEGLMSGTDELSAALDLLVDQLASSVIRATVREVESGLAAHPALGHERIGAAFAGIAERTVAGAVRAFAAEMRTQLRALRVDTSSPRIARELSRQVVEGAFEAIAARLRRPAVRRAAAAAAFVAAGFFAARTRAR